MMMVVAVMVVGKPGFLGGCGRLLDGQDGRRLIVGL
jgi:hypothetical protein